MAAEPQAVTFHPSWPQPSRDLVLRAIDRHGGWSLWSRLESVTIGLVSLSGLLPWAKGYGRTFTVPRAITVLPGPGRATWHEAPGQRCVGELDAGTVRLFDPATGALVAESPAHRRTFRGLRKLRRWSTMDALYFFGYAFLGYTAAPFVLPGLRFVAPVAGAWRGEALAGVQVEYPAGDIHSRRQSFLFDRSGLIRRHDYVADVVGPYATGAHGWDDLVSVEGLPLPIHRTVRFRLGRTVMPGPAVLAASFDGFSVRLAASPARAAGV